MAAATGMPYGILPHWLLRGAMFRANDPRFRFCSCSWILFPLSSSKSNSRCPDIRLSHKCKPDHIKPSTTVLTSEGCCCCPGFSGKSASVCFTNHCRHCNSGSSRHSWKYHRLYLDHHHDLLPRHTAQGTSQTTVT